MRREGNGVTLNQELVKRYLREAGFTSFQDARVLDTTIYGVRVEIEDTTKISQVLSVLGLPDLGFVAGRVTCVQDRHCDAWLNVEGVECQVEGVPRLHTGVLTDYFNASLLSQLRVTLQDFMLAINRSVRVKRRGMPALLLEPDGDAFTIWGWSAARETDRMRPPATVFGHHVRNAGDAGYAASGEGVALMDPDTGWCVAEVFADHLFIHHNWFSNCEADVHILSAILERVLPLLVADPEVWAARRAIAEAETAKRTRDGYVALVNQRFASTLRVRQTQLAELPAQIESARLTLQQLIRQEQSLARLVASMRAGDRSAQYQAEFDRILSLPKVTRFLVEGEKIVVHTTRLFCQNPKTGIIHRLAKMEITVDTKAREIKEVLRWRSLEGQVARETSRPAPHVIGSDGTACLGNAYESIAQLFAQQEWEQLIHLAILFVESVNIDDIAGSSLVQWPHATPAELIGTEWEGQQITVAA
jgi:hypothetical protein